MLRMGIKCAIIGGAIVQLVSLIVAGISAVASGRSSAAEVHGEN